MRLTHAALLVATTAVLLAGCATRRLVPDAEAPSVSLADRNERTGAETEFLRCSAEAESAYAPTRYRKEGEEEETKNKLAVFLGGTFEEEASGISFGLDYERLIVGKWAICAFAEHTFGDARETVAGVGLAYHPFEPVFIFGGAGVALSQDDAEQILLRVGGGWDIPIGRGLFLAPCAYLDWLQEGDLVIVAGVNIGKDW